MKVLIPIQSINDIITNSSSEVIVLDSQQLNKEDFMFLIGNISYANAYFFANDYIKKYPFEFKEFDNYIFEHKANFKMNWQSNKEETLKQIENYVVQEQKMTLDEFYFKLSHLIIVDIDSTVKNKIDVHAINIAYSNKNSDAVCIHSTCWG